MIMAALTHRISGRQQEQRQQRHSPAGLRTLAERGSQGIVRRSDTRPEEPGCVISPRLSDYLFLSL